MATQISENEMELVLMVWDCEKGRFAEQERQTGFYPSITLFELNVKGLEITDVNCYPILRRTVVFAHKKEEKQ